MKKLIFLTTTIVMAMVPFISHAAELSPLTPFWVYQPKAPKSLLK